MKRFIIEQDFWDIFPDARIGVVLCLGVDNARRGDDRFGTMLREAELAARAHIGNEVFSENPVVKTWREAYRRFKTKGGARCSIEALLNRVAKGNTLPSINPLVDIYNSVSLTYGFPCGGEDIDAFAGEVRLTVATGGEPFVTLGSDENAPPQPGEVVYKDEAGAICRCWNWRESVRTMLTENTRNAFLCMELPDTGRTAELEAALAELARLVREHLAGECRTALVDSSHRELQLE